LEYDEALAALAWQVELGADEAILDAPINRYEAVVEAPKPAAAAAAMPKKAPPVGRVVVPEIDVAAVAQQAANVPDLAALHTALAGFEHCELKRGARNCVFADGNPKARVMVIGGTPGREEDITGKPFVGREGQLLDRMFDAIGMGREQEDVSKALYVTKVVPWRPPQNRDPLPEEIAMLLPFLERHVQLIDPKVIVLMGNVPCQALLAQKSVTRLRGTWAEALGRPVMPMFAPEYLLRNPRSKREVWADLLSLQAKLRKV